MSVVQDPAIVLSEQPPVEADVPTLPDGGQGVSGGRQGGVGRGWQNAECDCRNCFRYYNSGRSGEKKQIYQDILKVYDDFWFDPDTLEFAGFTLVNGQHQSLQPNPQG